MMPFILLQIIFIPALISLLIFIFRYQLGKKAGWLAIIGLTYTTSLLLVVLYNVYQGNLVKVDYPLIINPDIRFSLLADGLSIIIALICNFVLLALSIYSIKYIDHRIEILYEGIDNKGEISYYTCFFYLFMLFPVGFIGLCFAANLIFLYFFLEILTITFYFLLAYFGYYERVKVAMMFLLWGIFSALFTLAGIILIYSQVGSFQIDQIANMAGSPMAFWTIALMLLGMFAKIAIVPLHVWIPWVHSNTPTSTAALMAIYANIVAYIVVRVLVLPLWNDFQWFGPPIMILGLATMIYGSLLTLGQKDMKRIPACSTISQCAYSMLGIGALTAASIEGGLFFFLSHIMGKTVFFSAAGMVVYSTHIRNTDLLSGLIYKIPMTAMLFIVGGLMLAGIPPFSSFISEVIMFQGIFERADTIGITIGIVGLMAVLLTVGYVAYFALTIFFGDMPVNIKNDEHIKDPPLSMALPLVGIVLLGAFLGLYPSIVLDLFAPVISEAVANM